MEILLLQEILFFLSMSVSMVSQKMNEDSEMEQRSVLGSPVFNYYRTTMFYI